MILTIINYTGSTVIFSYLTYVRVKSDYMYNESFARLVILYAALVTSLHSCIVHTPIFDRAALSTPANSVNPKIPRQLRILMYTD